MQNANNPQLPKGTKSTAFFIITMILLVQVISFYFNSVKTAKQTVISSNQIKIKRKLIQKLPVKKLDKKYILQWTSPNDVPYKYFDKKLDYMKVKCPYTNCIVTANRSYFDDYTKFDVIAFAAKEVVFYSARQLPKKRSPHQKYVFASMESSDNYPVCSNRFNGYFNWTWTYKLDSEVTWGYYSIRDKNNVIVGPKPDMHWMRLEDMNPVSEDFKQQLKTKTRAAVWFVSNCHTKSRREHVVQKLKKELHKYHNNTMVIDVYGDCGYLKCSRDIENDCDKLIKQKYYFYLAFENSLSEDYVTEKLLRALNNNAVPIVYGGANYTRFMPDGIYINANQSNIKTVAAKMNELIKDPEKYAEFFKWKNHYSYHKQYESVETNPYCILCTTLNNEETVKKTTIYDNFPKWWTPRRRCWFN